MEIPRPVGVLGFIKGEPVRDWLWLLPQWGADIGLCDTRGEGGNAGESQAGGDCAVKPSFFVLTDKRAVGMLAWGVMNRRGTQTDHHGVFPDDHVGVFNCGWLVLSEGVLDVVFGVSHCNPELADNVVVEWSFQRHGRTAFKVFELRELSDVDSGVEEFFLRRM